MLELWSSIWNTQNGLTRAVRSIAMGYVIYKTNPGALGSPEFWTAILGGGTMLLGSSGGSKRTE